MPQELDVQKWLPSWLVDRVCLEAARLGELGILQKFAYHDDLVLQRPRDEKGRSPFMLAAVNSYPDVCVWLLENLPSATQRDYLTYLKKSEEVSSETKIAIKLKLRATLSLASTAEQPSRGQPGMFASGLHRRTPVISVVKEEAKEEADSPILPPR